MFVEPLRVDTKEESERHPQKSSLLSRATSPHWRSRRCLKPGVKNDHRELVSLVIARMC